MTTMADKFLSHINVTKGKTRKRTKVKVRFIELLRPDCLWPHLYSLEQALHIFQWMVRTGVEYRKSGQSGVWDLLSLKPTCINSYGVEPIISAADLQKRFHYALLASPATDSVEQWRNDYNIHVDGERCIYFPHYNPDKVGLFSGKHGDYSESLLDSFLTTKGKLKVSLNECHKKARQIKGIELNITKDKFYFELSYGFVTQSSSWKHELARTTKGESFIDTFSRAIKALNALL